MRVAFTGSRSWPDFDAIRKVLQRLYGRSRAIGEQLVVIHGECPTGVDKMVDVIAKSMGLIPETYPAQWDLYGNAAGNIRNREMLEQSQPVLVIAFFNPADFDKLTRSGAKRRRTGTLNCVEIAEELGIPVEFYTPQQELLF